MSAKKEYLRIRVPAVISELGSFWDTGRFADFVAHFDCRTMDVLRGERHAGGCYDGLSLLAPSRVSTDVFPRCQDLLEKAISSPSPVAEALQRLPQLPWITQMLIRTMDEENERQRPEKIREIVRRYQENINS